MLAQVRSHRVQRVRSEHIVVVDEADELPGRKCERGIRCSRDTTRWSRYTTRTRAIRGGGVEHGAHVRLRDRVIRDAQLKVRIRLPEHRCDRFLEPRPLGVVHRHDQADDACTVIALGDATHGRELLRAGRVQREPAAVLAATGSRCVRHTDRPAQLAVATDEPGQRRGTLVDERQGPGRRPVEGLLAPRLGRHDTPRPARQRKRDPRRRAAGGLGKLGPERLELGLELGDVAACRQQLLGEPVDLVARRRHGAGSGGVASAISGCIERRWYARAPTIRRSLVMLELELDASPRAIRIGDSDMTVVAQESGTLEAIQRPRSVFQRNAQPRPRALDHQLQAEIHGLRARLRVVAGQAADAVRDHVRGVQHAAEGRGRTRPIFPSNC